MIDSSESTSVKISNLGIKKDVLKPTEIGCAPQPSIPSQNDKRFKGHQFFIGRERHPDIMKEKKWTDQRGTVHTDKVPYEWWPSSQSYVPKDSIQKGQPDFPPSDEEQTTSNPSKTDKKEKTLPPKPEPRKTYVEILREERGGKTSAQLPYDEDIAAIQRAKRRFKEQD